MLWLPRFILFGVEKRVDENYPFESESNLGLLLLCPSRIKISRKILSVPVDVLRRPWWEEGDDKAQSKRKGSNERRFCWNNHLKFFSFFTQQSNLEVIFLVHIMGDSAYSFSLTTFSRTGKLLQIEYALNAVANGRTALGICAVDGVVLATDKKVPSVLVDNEDVHKIETITPTTGFCYAGVGPDYRVLGKSLKAKYGSHSALLRILRLQSIVTWY